MVADVTVALEIARKRTFATALEWPGWSRSGRDEAGALEALLRHGPRFARAMAAAGVAFEPPADAARLIVVERLAGTSGTEFGAPSVPPSFDAGPLDAAELDRLVVVLGAAWTAFDEAARLHAGDELRKGPRGGGRDIPRMVAHVRDAEAAYLVQLGARPPKTGPDPAGMAELHAAALSALYAIVRGVPVENPSRVTRAWMPRYYVRRAVWHALDHAWEIEDRAIPGDATGSA